MGMIDSKFAGTCAACGERFPAGTPIDYDRRAPRGRKARHVDCASPDAPSVSYEVRTSGGTFYQNRGGRCEDAPCCGCCTF